ncbi:hypothetical protein MKW92_036301, partial [Papaver armeniacum]
MANVEYRCFVGGIAWAVSDDSLTKLSIINDRETGISRSFGFVTFANEQSMKDAIEG